jgi:drug/metabolite transporter (DMT)-like permease
MLAALATVLLWSASTVVSTRAARLLGGVATNRARLVLAAIGLGIAAALHGSMHAGPAAAVFVVSGMIGLGVGDVGLFLAYERLGSRLPALITHTLAAPMATGIEWAWLGTTIAPREAALIATILAGVALALAPDRRTGIPRARFWRGLAGAVVSAAATALGAVLSRKGYQLAIGAAAPMHWLDATLWRSLGGVGFMFAIWPIMRAIRPAPATVPAGGVPPAGADWRRGWPWLVGTTACGPGLGLMFYQLALVRSPSGLVQAVVALVPIAVMPLAWWLEADRPSWRAVVGGLAAVGGVIGIALGHR